jgi:hypothetical protein
VLSYLSTLALLTSKTTNRKRDIIGDTMWDWLTDTWEYITPGQDDKGIFANVGDWWSGDEETSTDSAFSDDLFKELGIDPVTGEYSDDTVTTINPIEYSEGDPFQWLYESDPDFAYDILKDQQDENTALWDENWDEDEYQGIFGWGIGPKLNQMFTGGQGLAGLLGGGGGDGKKGGGSGGLLGGEGLLGGSGLETLIKLAMINKLRKQDRDDPNEVVPIGSDAFSAVGQGQGLGSMPDYRIFNLQPALMPGVGYANAPPPEMKHGGLASLDQGPGDITLARLEPGEFVMTRKATDNIGAKNLYRLMKEAERMA